MVGLLRWNQEGRFLRPIPLREVNILHVRFLCADMSRGERMSAAAERRKLRSAGKKLLRQGIERVVLPSDVPADALPEGLRPAGTLSLRRAIAADWCGALLRLRGENPAAARVLVTANALSGEVVRTVTELALRHRYLILKVPFGGEELCRRLRREYGVSIVLNPETEREPASIHMAFDPTEAQGGGFLPLYDESLPLPRLLLPPEVEARLPEGLDRGQLLSVLWRTGALRPGQVSVQLGETENKGAVPEIRAFCP